MTRFQSGLPPESSASTNVGKAPLSDASPIVNAGASDNAYPRMRVQPDRGTYFWAANSFAAVKIGCPQRMGARRWAP